MSQAIQQHTQEITANDPNIKDILSEDILRRLNEGVSVPESPDQIIPEFIGFSFEDFENFGFIGIEHVMNTVFQQLGNSIDFATHGTLVKQYLYRIIRTGKNISFFTGLVFTGFGDDVIFPSLNTIRLSLAINDLLRYWVDPDGTISVTQRCQRRILQKWPKV